MSKDEDFPAEDSKPKGRTIPVQVLRDTWVKNPKPENKGIDGNFIDETMRIRAGTRKDVELTDEILDQIEAGALRRVKDDELDDEPIGMLDKKGHLVDLPAAKKRKVV